MSDSDPFQPRPRAFKLIIGDVYRRAGRHVGESVIRHSSQIVGGAGADGLTPH